VGFLLFSIVVFFTVGEPYVGRGTGSRSVPGEEKQKVLENEGIAALLPLTSEQWYHLKDTALNHLDTGDARTEQGVSPGGNISFVRLRRGDALLGFRDKATACPALPPHFASCSVAER
jgi:hypothetical protein